MNLGGIEDLKVLGIGPQLDLGNFTVGLATIIIAFVTLYVAIRNTKSANNHKLAEFRQVWIDDLRSNVAQFTGCIDGSLNFSCSAAEGRDCHSEMDKQFSEIKRLESYILLKLNQHENDHQILEKLIVITRGRAAHFSRITTAQASNEVHDLIVAILDFTRILLKVEWDRVRYETRGQGALRRFVSSNWRAWRRRKLERETRSRVEKILSRNSLGF